MPVTNSVLLRAHAEYSCFLTLMRKASVKSRSISTLYVSWHASCGATRAGPRIRSISTCGMTILSQLETSDSERLASLPHLPRDEGGPVFAEPWQAQAFAMAV